MNADRNKEIVLDTWSAFWRGEIEAGLANFADDASWVIPGANRYAGTFAGKDAIRTFRFEALDVFSEIERKLVGIYADGDTVVVESAVTGRLRNGAPYENAACIVCQLRDGLVRYVREYLDTERAMAIDSLADE